MRTTTSATAFLVVVTVCSNASIFSLTESAIPIQYLFLFYDRVIVHTNPTPLFSLSLSLHQCELVKIVNMSQKNNLVFVLCSSSIAILNNF